MLVSAPTKGRPASSGASSKIGTQTLTFDRRPTSPPPHHLTPSRTVPADPSSSHSASYLQNARVASSESLNPATFAIPRSMSGHPSDLPPGAPQLPPGAIVFGPKANCTLDICPVQYSVYGYLPSLAANITFIALYALAAAIHTYLGIRWKQWWFMGCMILGALNASIGYVGRVIMHFNPFNFAAFMLQISKASFPRISRQTNAPPMTSRD